MSATLEDVNANKGVIFTTKGYEEGTIEYASKDYAQLIHTLGIQQSMSRPGCPWENGYQDSFYKGFKIDLGDPNRFDTLGELVAEVYQTIHYYNTFRIHSALAMAPRVFAAKASIE